MILKGLASTITKKLLILKGLDVFWGSQGNLRFGPRTLGLRRMRHPSGKNPHPWTTKDAAPLRKVESKPEIKT